MGILCSPFKQLCINDIPYHHSCVQLRRCSASLVEVVWKWKCRLKWFTAAKYTGGLMQKKREGEEGQKEQYWSIPGCQRALLMIRDGKINSGRNEKDWSGSETIKKKWWQNVVWEEKTKKDDGTSDKKNCNFSLAFDLIINFYSHPYLSDLSY